MNNWLNALYNYYNTPHMFQTPIMAVQAFWPFVVLALLFFIGICVLGSLK